MNRSSRAILLALLSSFILLSGLFPNQHTGTTWKEFNGVNIPVPPAVHPRLYLRREHVADLANRINDPDLARVWSDLQKMKEDRTAAEIPETKDWRFYFDTKGLLNRAELKAMEYLLTGNALQGREAITLIIDSLEKAVFPPISDISRAIGRHMITGSIVYDWCYDQLSAGEKTRFVNALVRLAKMLESGYPPVKGNSVVGHVSEWMLMRDLLSTGIAIYDEFPEMYNLTASRFFKEFLPVRNWFYPAGAYHQGMSYLNVRLSSDLFALWIFDRMGFSNIYDSSQQYVLYDMIYKRRPDGQMMPGGDVNYSRTGSVKYPMATMLAGSYYKDEYINGEFRKDPRMPDNQAKLFDFLWRDTKLGTRKPDDLPLTRYSGTPYGWMIARTGWDSESVIAEMKINEYNFLNHQHHDAGAFQLYYKGPLAIDAGLYEGTDGGYDSNHNKNFFKRTIAHNSLLVYNPNELFPSSGYGGSNKSTYVDNDGGQRLPGGNWSPPFTLNDLLTEDYKTGTVLATSVGPDKQIPEYSYLKGDITEAYSAKVKEMKRSFLFLNLKNKEIPAALIVFDKVVSSNASFKKFWLLHSIEEPAIHENRITIKRTNNGDTGMLVNTVLLPEANNADIVPVGGPGKEFWVFGTNYPQEPTNGKDEANERGAWRVEVSPRTAKTEDYYLNVMQVAGNDQQQLHEVKMIQGDKVVGAQIADRISMFSKSATLISDSFTFNVTTEGRYKYVLTDLDSGKWELKRNGEEYVDTFTVELNQGLVNFEGLAGEYQLTNLNYVADTPSVDVNELVVTVFPNPATDILNINVSNPNPGIQTVQVFTSQGKLLSEHNFAGDSLQTDVCQIGIRDYPPGIYFLRLSSEDDFRFSKFLKL
jgi:heparin/heparan-sulfate lyase